MNNLLSLILIIGLICASTPEGLAQQKPGTKTPKAPPEEPVRVSADHISQDTKTDIIRAWGHVVVRYQGRTLKADKILLNNRTGLGKATGNVVMTDPEGTFLKAERTLFNTKSEQGRVFNVKGRVANKYYIKGKEVTRITNRHYKVTEGAVTTCKGKLPDWLIEADSLDLVKGDRAFFTGGVFRVRNIPLLYLPIGYIPIDRERKTGFLLPSFGSSNTDGTTVKNAFFWAINQQSDATVEVDYMSKRGVRTGLEYRYTPSQTTAGKMHGTFLNDNKTGSQFWKVDASHRQELPYGFNFKGRLDLESDNEFNKTFEDNTEQRTRRSTDSFASLNKIWPNNTLDILARFRDSTEATTDDRFGLLPEVTFKTQPITIGKSRFYFNQDSSFTQFLTDLNPDPIVDDEELIQRIDIHPQIFLPFRLGSWLSVTPTVGWRETYYSEGFGINNTRLAGFSRELFDTSTVLEGPKVSKIFHTSSRRFSKIKHVIEPRVIYNYIPDIDEKDRDKIKIFDAIDAVQPHHLLTYSLTQRLFQKEVIKENIFQTREILRVEISQTYDIREATRDQPSGVSSRPFSPLRFDLDSRPFEPLLLNFDTTYNVHDNIVETINFEAGLKPTDWLLLFVERRFSRVDPTFITGTFDLHTKKGWHFLYSARYDESTQTFRENDVSLLYDDPCQCWGFSLDFINREIVTNGISQDETRVLFGITLRGLGSIRSTSQETLLHRTF